MQKFYIQIEYIPEPDRPINVLYSTCVEINLPDKCQHCNTSVIIYLAGSANDCGSLDIKTCVHFKMWPDLWANRIANSSQPLNEIAVIEVLNSLNDGCKCNKCGLFYSMAAPNQIDNTFKCYTCRNRGW